MSGSKSMVSLRGIGSGVRAAMSPMTKALHGRKAALALALGVLMANAGCSDDLFLSANNLDIGPDPAQPGDQVVATFFVNLIPTQPHTYIFFIDGEEHLRIDRDERPEIPVVLELGDASDLIDTHGTGEHVAQVQVRLQESGQSARTEVTTFELQDGGS